MAVEWQFLPVKWQGMDTKTDDKNLPTGKLSLLQNMVMQKTGKLQKRYGFIQTAVQYSTGHSVFEYEGLRYTMSQSKITLADLRDVSQNVSMLQVAASKQVVYTGDTSTATTVGMSWGTGTEASTFWYTATFDLKYQQLDAASGVAISVPASVAGAREFCAIQSPLSTPLCVATTYTQLRLYKFTSTAATNLLTINSIASIQTTPRAFAYLSDLYVAYKIVASISELVYCTIADPGAAVVRTVTLDGNITALPYFDICVSYAGKVLVAYWQVSGADAILTLKRFNSDLSTLESTTGLTTVTGGATTVREINITKNGSTNECAIFAYVDPGSGNDYTIYQLIGSNRLMYGVKPVSRAWTISRDGSNFPHCWLQATGTESSLMLQAFPQNITNQSPVTMSVLYGRTPNPLPQYQSQVSEDNMQFAFAEIYSGVVTAGTTNTFIGIRYLKLTSTIKTVFAYPPRQCAHDANSCIKFFDGNQDYLASTPHAPRTPTIANAGGTSLAAGTYLYCLLIEWTDSVGNILRSAPSASVSITLGAPADVRVTHITTLQSLFSHIGINGAVQNARYVIYRTDVNGSVFYRLYAANFITSGVGITYLDQVVNVATSTPLYTTGGSLENIAPPPFRSIAAGVSRIFGLSWETDSLWFSKKFVEGEVPQFNEALSAQIERVGGSPIAVIEMDDKIVVFKERAISVFFGDGPDETGAGQFQGPQVVNSEIGAVSDRAVVLTDEGIIFKSQQGIWLLNRGLSCQYIGAEVEDYNSLTYVGCFNLSDRNQTWFFTAEGTTLCYDSYHRLWSVFSDQAAKSVCTINSVPTYLHNGTNYVAYESKSTWTERGNNYACAITTGWISLAGLQGFQRIRRVAFMGAKYATHIVTVQAYYDFSASVQSTYTVASDTIAADGVYQYQLRLNQQKCEAVKFVLSMTSSNQGFDLSGMSLEVGIKPKTARMAATKRVAGV